MTPDQEQMMMQRIDAALLRIERAAKANNPDKPSHVNDPQLIHKHERMRARVSEALTQVDAMIGRLSK